MCKKIILLFGSFASVISLYLIIRPAGILSGIELVLITAFVVSIIFYLSEEIKKYYENKPKSFLKEDDINSYMYNWISKGGRVAICTRDMTWANSKKMTDMLHNKARSDELCICLPQQIDLTKALEQSGAEIHTYEQLNYTPKSRFTIINKDKMDAQVAVGRRIKQKHVIEEYAEGEHPVFAVANDLVEIIINYSKINGGLNDNKTCQH